jgi:hypothetical protein
MPWAALLLASGYVMREVGAFNTGNLDFLISSVVLIMSGPPAYAAIDYFILSRIMFYIPSIAPLHPGRITTTFLGIDAIIEAMIGNGAARLANLSLSASQREIGAILVKVSLILQAIMFVLFVTLTAYFHRQAIKRNVLNRNIKHVLYTLYVSSGLITIRCIYRIVEFFEGWEGELNTHEAYFYVFDASFMLLNTVMFNIWHPGKRLPPNNHTFLSKDGQTELTGPGWQDDRQFWVTFFDPFDIGGLIRGKDKKTRFWDMSPEELEAFNKAEKERRKRKRPVYLEIIDPFHLVGSGGLFAKLAGRSKQSALNPTHEVDNSHEQSVVHPKNKV